jgi:hypothetical protein
VDEQFNNNALADLVLSGNTFRNTQSNTSSTFQHVRVRADATSHGASGTLTYSITGNDLRDSQQAPIYIAKADGQLLLDGSISNNIIGNSGIANSGAFAGEGIRIEHSGDGKHRTLINNNQVYQYNNIGGISIRALSSISGANNNGSVHATITNNTVSNPGNQPANFIDGVHLDFGTAAGTTYTMCLNFGHTGGANNIANGGQVASSGVPFSIGPASSTNTGFLKILGLTGGPFTGHAGESPVDSRISADNGVTAGANFLDFGASANVTASTDNSKGVACTLP